MRLAATLLATAAITAVAASPCHAALPGQNGRIAFAHLDAGSGCNIPNCNYDVYSMNADGTDVVQVTTDPGSDREPAWSPDGTKIAFTTNRDDPSPGTCQFCVREVYVMNADGSGVTRVTHDMTENSRPSWAPDGETLVYKNGGTSCDDIAVIRTDGTGKTRISAGADPAWSTDGQQIVVRGGSNCSSALATVSPDGAGERPVPGINAPTGPPDWAPDSTTLVYTKPLGSGDQEAYVRSPDGTEVKVTSGAVPRDPVWSPDGTKIAFTSGTDILIINGDGSGETNVTNSPDTEAEPDWQPVAPAPPVAGFPRPKGASPLMLSLVPAFKPCAGANSTHGAPLSFPSCTPPVPASDYLTIGTPDSNGQPVKSVGSVTLKAMPGSEATLESEADVQIVASITDVRCKITTEICSDGPLSDYAGALGVSATWRLTDRFNTERAAGQSGAYPSAATSVDPVPGLDFPANESPLSFYIVCAPTADATVGSRCDTATTLNAVVPGAVREGKRMTIELGALHVYDGGTFGNPSVGDATLFLTQGIFIP